MSNQYLYCAFGMQIRTNKPITQLKQSVVSVSNRGQNEEPSKDPNTEVNIHIHEGVFDEVEQLNSFCLLQPGLFGIKIPDIAIFRLENGTTIDVYPYPNASLEAINMYLLGLVIGGVFHQRKYLVMHGNTIAIGGNCAMIVGHSGSGKSTISGELIRRGHKLVADDVSLFKELDRNSDPMSAYKPEIIPSYPLIKLSKSQISEFNFSEYRSTQVNLENGKYYVDMSHCFRTNAVKLDQIIVLSKSNIPTLIIRELEGQSKWNGLKHHIYRPRMAANMHGGLYLQGLAQGYLPNIRCSSIIRTDNSDTVSMIADFVESATSLTT